MLFDFWWGKSISVWVVRQLNQSIKSIYLLKQLFHGLLGNQLNLPSQATIVWVIRQINQASKSIFSSNYWVSYQTSNSFFMVVTNNSLPLSIIILYHCYLNT